MQIETFLIGEELETYQEKLVCDWLSTSHVTQITRSDWLVPTSWLSLIRLTVFSIAARFRVTLLIMEVRIFSTADTHDCRKRGLHAMQGRTSY